MKSSVAVAVFAALVFGHATPAFADAESQTDTGVLMTGPEAPPLTAQQEVEIQNKSAEIEALAAELRVQETAGTATSAGSADTTESAFLIPVCENGEPCSSGKPAKYSIPASANMTIHSQNKSYTCGPGSLRNMVLSMNKTRNGAYSSLSEAALEDLVGTTTQGTWIEDIARVLNSRYDSYGTWKTSNPSDKHAYLASVATDTFTYSQPLIQGVRTDKLGYFNGKRLNHFNVVYGYSRGDRSTYIKIQEGWDPVKIYGSVPSYGNPYGHRSATLASAFEANDISGNGLKRLII